MRLTESQQRETPLGSDWQFAVERSTTSLARADKIHKDAVDHSGGPRVGHLRGTDPRRGRGGWPHDRVGQC
jgi:hypothetical protein